jgi:hypothetical protein
MYAKIISNPPLGQTTIVRGGQPVHFTVLLETDETSVKQWEVALWSDIPKGSSNQDWVAHMFEELSNDNALVSSARPWHCISSMLTAVVL